jgi:Tol biopolymer transport system component/DNA-binding winged helix-turn-helix (wHTH) protein
MSSETPHFYEFENFRLDPSAKMLLRDNAQVPLTPKVFDTLQFLVEHAGRLLGKDELMQEIWQDRIVDETNLTYNIKMLRRALCDNAQQPRFIETVPRRGYRFIAQVRESPAEQPVRSITEPELQVALPVKRRSYFPLAFALVALTACVLSAFWLVHTRSENPAPSAPLLSAPLLSTPFRSEPFSTNGRLHAVITPDGKYVAYTNETEAKEAIWLRQLETSENIQIVPPSDHAYLGLAISHDGNSLYFVRRHRTDDTPSALYRVMTFGGTPVKLAEKMEGSISVSPNDRQLSFVRCKYEEEDYCSLYVVGADGTNERRLLATRRPARISDNQFSPDGNSIVYAVGESANGGSDFRIMSLDLSSAKERQVSARTFFNINDLKWLPNGSGLLVAARENLYGRIRIWQVAIGDGDARALTRDATDYVSMSLDRAGTRMIATNATNTFHLYVTSGENFANANALTSARTVTFAPDGKIVYSGNDGDIWTINPTGGEQRQLTNNSGTNFSPRVSPDGGYIFFTSNRTGTNQIWRMNSDGGNQVQLTRTEGGYPRFVTSDGKWVYFESGLHETIWQVASDGSAEFQVSQKPAVRATFSPDGKLAAYLFRAELSDKVFIGVMSVPDGSLLKSFPVADTATSVTAMVWAKDNKSFDYVTTGPSKTSLWHLSLAGNVPRLVAELGNDEIQDIAMSPDGNDLAFIRGKWIHDAVLIEGLK